MLKDRVTLKLDFSKFELFTDGSVLIEKYDNAVALHGHEIIEFIKFYINNRLKEQ